MSSRKITRFAVLVFGLSAIAVGAVLVATYVSLAVIARLGDPDQSLLYWYSRLLLTGFAAVALGAVVASVGGKALRPNTGPSERNDAAR